MSIAPPSTNTRLSVVFQRKLTECGSQILDPTTDIQNTARNLAHLVVQAQSTLDKPSAIQGLLAGLGVQVENHANRADPVLAGALATLIGRWSDIHAQTRRELLTTLKSVPSSLWQRAIAQAAQSNDDTNLYSTLSLAAALDSSDSWHSIASLVMHPNKDIARSAAQAIEHRVSKDTTSKHPGAQMLASLVRQLLSSWSHHEQSAIAHAALIIASCTDADPPTQNRTPELIDEHAPFSNQLRTRLRRSKHPATLKLALQWVKYPTIAAAALDRIYQDASTATSCLIASSELILHPLRQRLLDHEASSYTSVVTNIDPGMARCGIGLLRLLEVSSTSSASIEQAAQKLFSSESPIVRVASLSHLPGVRARDAQFSKNGTESLSAMLRTHWGAQTHGVHDPSKQADISLLLRHADERVRRCAKSIQIPTELRRALGRSSESEDIVPLLREALLTAHAIDKTRAMQFAASLGMADDLLPEIITIATSQLPIETHDQNAQVDLEAQAALRAQAIATHLIGQSTAIPEAQSALALCLKSRDDRVRANAVEALHSLARNSPTHTPIHGLCYACMIEHKSDDHQRVRANAIRNLLVFDHQVGRTRTREASIYDTAGVMSLETMLHDQREPHAISAMWIARRLAYSGQWRTISSRWKSLADRVGTIMQTASTEHLHASAATTNDAMHRSLRESWARDIERASTSPLRTLSSLHQPRRAVTSTRWYPNCVLTGDETCPTGRSPKTTVSNSRTI